MGATTPSSARAGRGIGPQRQHLRRASRASPRPAGPVVDPLRGPDRGGCDAQAAAICASTSGASAPLRSSGGAAKASRSPLTADAHEAGAALLHDLVAARPVARGEPGLAAAQRRMAREGQLARGREDAHPVVGARHRGGSRKVVSLQVGPARKGLHRASSSRSASCTTAKGLPRQRHCGEDVELVEATFHRGHVRSVSGAACGLMGAPPAVGLGQASTCRPRRWRSPPARTAPSPAPAVSPSTGTAKRSERNGCTSCTWLTRTAPPSASPRYQAKKPSHIEKTA